MLPWLLCILPVLLTPWIDSTLVNGSWWLLLSNIRDFIINTNIYGIQWTLAVYIWIDSQHWLMDIYVNVNWKLLVYCLLQEQMGRRGKESKRKRRGHGRWKGRTGEGERRRRGEEREEDGGKEGREDEGKEGRSVKLGTELTGMM
ncbi:hypothetical protein BDQ17DRAFT_1457803 [Cyathus striatus]|nr:hypothetical protein BDQ17DRAFT_1457803 [Cyathus striatus]